jgi:hypothetical protein
MSASLKKDNRTMSKKMAFHLPQKAAKIDAPMQGKGEADAPKRDPKALLQQAMARHELHASGAEVATDESNGKLKADLQAALDALTAEESAEEDPLPPKPAKPKAKK